MGTEAAIQAALAAVRAGRTVLLIAHRLSTVKDAQQILVVRRGEAGASSWRACEGVALSPLPLPLLQLGEGRVLERGTHEELLALPEGAYRGMWQRQLTEPTAAASASGAISTAAAPGPTTAAGDGGEVAAQS